MSQNRYEMLKIKCVECGHEWREEIGDRLKTDLFPCPCCGYESGRVVAGE